MKRLRSALAGCTAPQDHDCRRAVIKQDRLMHAEACTELGANQLPLHRSAAAYMLAPFFERWPRSAGLVLALVIVALLGLAGERPVDILAADHLPGDGFPAELLAAPVEVATAASEAQP